MTSWNFVGNLSHALLYLHVDYVLIYLLWDSILLDRQNLFSLYDMGQYTCNVKIQYDMHITA